LAAIPIGLPVLVLADLAGGLRDGEPVSTLLGEH